MASSSLTTEATSMLLLKGMTALVAGASGEVGRGAAYALSQAGAYVYLAGRSADKLSAIQRTLPYPDMSSIIAADYSSLNGARDFQALVGAELPQPTLDVVVASSGPWWRASHIAGGDVDLDTLYGATQANFNAHLFLYNILVPKLRPTTGRYLLINGAAAKNITRMGVTAVMANAVVGAAQLMHAQSKDGASLPHRFTHVLLASSVGHEAMRGPSTNDPNEYGKAFVAMALDQHARYQDQQSGTLELNDAMAAKLIAGLSM